MADGDHVAAPDEQVRLAEGDAPVEHLGRSRDDEQRLAVLLELGPLMGLEGVLDGEVVQAELRLELPQEVEARLVQADPDHMAGLARPFAGLLDRDLGHAPAADIDGRGDDAGGVLWPEPDTSLRGFVMINQRGDALSVPSPGSNLRGRRCGPRSAGLQVRVCRDASAGAA